MRQPLATCTQTLGAIATLIALSACSGGPASAPVGTASAPTATPATVAVPDTHFQADSLRGQAYAAATSRGDACSIAVDTQGNATLSWTGLDTAQGQLQLPVSSLVTPELQTPSQAHYVVHYHKALGIAVQAAAFATPELRPLINRYSVTLHQEGGSTKATVVANELAGDPRSVTCSTAYRSPAPASALAQAGTVQVGQLGH